jgi:hypothetical protein
MTTADDTTPDPPPPPPPPPPKVETFNVETRSAKVVVETKVQRVTRASSSDPEE